MIRVVGRPNAPAPRLLAALRERGHAWETETSAAKGRTRDVVTWILGPPEGDGSPEGLEVPFRGGDSGRVLVISLTGAHPDTRVGSLRRLWELEERARAGSLPVLVLRLAPLLGPRSPLWLKLRSGTRLPRFSRRLFNPVAEEDALETMERALADRAGWDGWFEVAGDEAWTLDEVAALARHAGPTLGPPSGCWEPSLEVLAEQRLCDPGPWTERFGIRPARISERAQEWTQ